MLTYEKCLALKEAGFPQRPSLDLILPSGEITDWQYVDNSDGWCKLPSLSELIEACGDNFKSLIKHDPLDDKIKEFILAHGDYSACMYDRDITTWKNTMFGGKSPEEAVANLWLAINKK